MEPSFLFQETSPFPWRHIMCNGLQTLSLCPKIDHWLKMSHLLYFSSLSLNSLQSISVAWLYPRTPLIMRQDTLPRFKSPTGLLPGTHLVFHCLCKTYNVTLVVTMVDLTHTFADCRGWGRANSQHFFTVINGVLPSFFAHLKLSVLRLLSVF